MFAVLRNIILMLSKQIYSREELLSLVSFAQVTGLKNCTLWEFKALLITHCKPLLPLSSFQHFKINLSAPRGFNFLCIFHLLWSTWS